MSHIASRLCLNLYGSAGYAAYPFCGFYLRARARKGKEIKARLKERYGYAAPEVAKSLGAGRTIWVHAASIGETKAVLPLISRLTDTGFKVVFTTMTVSAAEVVAADLPKGAIHQFSPLDLKPFVRRFLKIWQPSLAVFVESELWPNTMTQLRKRKIPQVLVNARMSERSFARWKRFGSVTNDLFENINLCIAQSEEDAARFSELGVQGVIKGGNLKFDSNLPAINELDLARLQAAVGGRRLWLAASTHQQEELIVGKAHRRLKQFFPDLLTVIVPRHPNRAPSIASALRAMKLNCAQRSEDKLPTKEDDIYIADTIGELGLFYRLAPCCLVGGSLIPHGGQNPIEPARLGSAIIHGPNIANFAKIFDAFAHEGACVCVNNSEELVYHVADILSNEKRLVDMTQAADTAVKKCGGALERTHRALMPFLQPLIVSDRLANRQVNYVPGE